MMICNRAAGQIRPTRGLDVLNTRSGAPAWRPAEATTPKGGAQETGGRAGAWAPVRRRSSGKDDIKTNVRLRRQNFPIVSVSNIRQQPPFPREAMRNKSKKTLLEMTIVGADLW